MPKPIMRKGQALSALRFSMATHEWDADLFDHIVMVLTQAGYPPITIPDGYRILVEHDEYYEPDGDYDLEEERQKLATGEWSAYVVVLQKQCECGSWNVVGSLSGVVVETGNEYGNYTELDEIADPYLRHVACELIVDAED